MSEESNDTIYEGRVKWFNNKAGYGFVTVIGGDKDGLDVFSHHSSICVGDEQYKYLVQGEYIEFKISTMETDDSKQQATSICGVKGGKLLCETRNENRSSNPRRRNISKPRRHGAGPRDDEEWVLVKRSDLKEGIVRQKVHRV
jgi:cold shock CspA family protein